jgi:hypothetical protein
MKKLYFIAIALITIFSGCKKGDGDADYGYTYIYMPQATVSGSDQDYTVPSGSTSTYNFVADTVNNKLDVILGVLRSGKQSCDGYTVDVVVDNDTTNTMVANGTFTNGTLLPESMYTLPSTVTVPAGETSATFYLSIDAEALQATEYTDKNLILTVRIANPTKYSLYDTYSKTVVIIDVNSIRSYLK